VNNLLSLVGAHRGGAGVTSTATRGFPSRTPRPWCSPSRTGRWARSCCRTRRRRRGRGSRPRRRTAATRATPTKDCYHIAGTLGSLSVPTMRVKTFPRHPVLVGALRHGDGAAGAQRPARQPGRPFRGRHPRRGRADLQRTRRARDP
jgi:hypothetical protein